MSISGTSGVSGSAFEPDAHTIDTSAAPGAEPAAPSTSRTSSSAAPPLDPAAQRLLADLQGIKSGATGSMWSFLDATTSLRSLRDTAKADGKITAAEVKALVTDAFDYGKMTSNEKRVLKDLVKDHAAKFEPAAREALAQFLGVPNPMPSAPATPTTPTVPTTPTTPTTPNVPLVNVASPSGKTFSISADGYPVEKGRNDGPPGLRGAGAERIYDSGRALVEAPPGVLKSVPAPVQEKLLTNNTAWYDAALAEVNRSPVSPTDANKVRSGAVATLVALYEGAATPELKEKAASALLDRGLKEPVEGLRANIFVQLEGSRSELSPASRAKLDQLKETVLPSKPPYAEWFKNGNDKLNVVHYFHPESWDHGGDPVKDYERLGLKVKEHSTNDKGEEFWVLDGKIDGGNGKSQKSSVRIVKSHDEFVRDIDDPNIHAIFYDGHSNLGGNVSEALKRGPEENGKKLLSFGLCRGQQNIFEVANKYPNAHLSTSKDPSFFANQMDFVGATLKGIARRDTYEGINKKTDLSLPSEGVENYIRPNELRRFEYTDMDRDGQPEIGLDAKDRFFNVMTKDTPPERTDLKPRAEDRPAADIPGEAVMQGANFARTLMTYHVEHGPGDSPVKHIKGDRIEGAGWFEGSDDAVRITETRGKDGQPVYNVAVNKAYADQSPYAIGGLIQYEFTKHYAMKDGRFTADEKARALVMTGEYLSYMYCSWEESNAIMKAVGDRAGVRNLKFDDVYKAIETDGNGYSSDKQVQELRRRVSIS